MSSNDGPTGSEPVDDLVAWFAQSTVRVGLGLLGIVLLLFALGQATGLDLLGFLTAALARTTVQWLIVAVLAVLLILIALYGFDSSRQ